MCTPLEHYISVVLQSAEALNSATTECLSTAYVAAISLGFCKVVDLRLT